jgi:hypothetical protein
MPAVTAEFPSKTWNKATTGRMDATGVTTSALAFNNTKLDSEIDIPGSSLKI